MSDCRVWLNDHKYVPTWSGGKEVVVCTRMVLVLIVCDGGVETTTCVCGHLWRRDGDVYGTVTVTRTWGSTTVTTIIHTCSHLGLRWWSQFPKPDVGINLTTTVIWRLLNRGRSCCTWIEVPGLSFQNPNYGPGVQSRTLGRHESIRNRGTFEGLYFGQLT